MSENVHKFNQNLTLGLFVAELHWVLFSKLKRNDKKMLFKMETENSSTF